LEPNRNRNTAGFTINEFFAITNLSGLAQL
jgi:hypothetical protein